MALANYFSKNALALSQVLRGASTGDFERLLSAHVVQLAFDDSVQNTEGSYALDLSVKLLSRLFPTLVLTDITGFNNIHKARARTEALAINEHIEVSDTANPTVAIVIGDTPLRSTGVPIYYIGSEGWISKFSSAHPVNSGKSLMPFAAGVAACVGVSNVFRFVFKNYMTGPNDTTFELSLLNLDTPDGRKPNFEKTVDLGNVTIVGLGAIGNGVCWSLSHCPDTNGKLTLIDPEIVAASNLQRYVMTVEADIGKEKTSVLRYHLASQGRFILQEEPVTIGGYLLESANYDLEKVVVCLDSARDRIAVQSSLPQLVYNAFTESGLSAVTRHLQFGTAACLVCGFIPYAKQISQSQEIANNLGLAAEEVAVRRYVANNLPVDDRLLHRIAKVNGIAVENLLPFRGQPMAVFYSEVVCGGVLLSMRDADAEAKGDIEAPLAFQSALAGILLAADLYLDAAMNRNADFKNATHFHPLEPVRSGVNPFNLTLPRDATCICSDRYYVERYNEKWKR